MPPRKSTKKAGSKNEAIDTSELSEEGSKIVAAIV